MTFLVFLNLEKIDFVKPTSNCFTTFSVSFSLFCLFVCFHIWYGYVPEIKYRAARSCQLDRSIQFPKNSKNIFRILWIDLPDFMNVPSLLFTLNILCHVCLFLRVVFFICCFPKRYDKGTFIVSVFARQHN